MKRNRHINLKEKFRNWCEKTTFHAIPNIATNEQLALKVMWTFCLIASIGYCCRILTSSIIDYYEYRVLTTFEIVQEASTFYPSITICNLNQFDLTKNKNLTDFFFNSYLTGNYLNDSVDLSLDPKQQFDLIKRKFLNYTNSSELENLRFTLNDMLISCYYNELPCYESDFYPLPNEIYGNCYVFNSNLHRNNTLKSKVRNTSKYGPQYGLQLELFVGLNYQSFGNLRSGAILFIHNQSSLTDENDVGIELSSGTQSNIAINRMFIYKLAQPYSDCVDHNNLVKVEEIVRLTIEFHGYYSKSFCVDLCYQFYLLDQCNCYDNSAFYYLAKDYNSSRDVANCLSNNNTTDYYRDCYLRSKKNFLDSFYSEECFEKCPRECESVNYRIVSLSSAEYPSMFYESILAKTPNVIKKYPNGDLDFTNSLLSVNIYYDTDTYQKVTETPETSFDVLMGNLGGQFGLFLGISLLSFLELFELFIWMLVYFFQKVRDSLKRSSNRFLNA